MIRENKFLILQLQVFKIVLFLIFLFVAVGSNAQGLQFNSNDSLLAKRTSYAVFKNDQPSFHNHLRINFDLSLWDNEHLGYILNICDDKNNSYSLSSIYLNNAPYLNFNIDSKSNKITVPLTLSQLKKRNWMKVMVDIDLKANTVGINVNGKWYRAAGFNFAGSISPKIYFGKNEHYFDVPKMAIRDLTVADDDKSYHFLLNEWSGNKVYSTDNDNLGYVDNPVWLINESYFWAPRFMHGFKEVAGVNFDEHAQKLIMFKSDSLLSYDVHRNNWSVQAYQNRCPVPLLLGKSIINAKENKLYAYETLKSQKPGRWPSIATLDLNTLKWDVTGFGNIEQQRHHHNIFYNKAQDTFYLFGGYGSYSYYKDFFIYNKTTDSWDKVKFTGDNIDPRFFSGYSAADDNNDVYIFGGYGNQSGNQVVGGQHFYDLYRVNLTNHTIKKLWEIKPPAEDFVAANNLIISKDKKYFYAICYAHDKPKTSLRLYKYAIADGSYEVVSGSIPAKGERIESDINLFYNPEQESFYCAIQEFTTPDYSTIRIYSLTSPPVTEAEYQASQHERAVPDKPYGYIVAVALAITIALAYRRRKKGKASSEPAEIDIDTDAAVVAIHKKEDTNKVNAIYLMGDFTAYDKNGRDVTYLFSPKIKQLFILILLNSRNDGGVTSKRISTTLWPDKDISKTKNIKGVTINHLRNIISDFNGLELTFTNDTYSFKISNELYCDYFVVTDAVNRLSSGKQDNESIMDHFDLISRGSLLQYIPETWLDDVKVTYEEAVMNLLLPEVKKIYDSGDYRRTSEITRVMLNMDPFNDGAIKFKLKALRRTKGIDYARKQYDDFIAEYQKSLGVEYPIPFDKICSNK